MNEEIDSKRYYKGIAILVFAFGLISLLVFQFVLAKGMPTKNNCEGKEVDMFRTQLTLIPSSDSLKRQNVEEKIEVWETMIAICEGATPAPSTPNVTQQFIQATSPSFAEGIFEGQPGAYFHAFEAEIENHWKGIVNGNRVIVFAGAWVDDPDQGFIAVLTAPSKGKSVWGYYPSATKSGALRIVDAWDSRLIIQQANNKNDLFFDVPSLSFVASIDESVVTSTPFEILTTVQPTTIPYPYPVP